MRKIFLAALPVFFIFCNPLAAQQFIRHNTDALFADNLSSRHSVWVDISNKGKLDLFTTSIYNKPNLLYQEEYERMQQKIPVFSGKDGGNANGSAWADIDADGDLDCFVFNIFGQKNDLYKNNADGTFQKITSSSLSSTDNNAFNAAFCDYDEDGDQDIFITNTELWTPEKTNKKNLLFDNDGAGKFTIHKDVDFASPKSDSRACAWGDYNNDGLMDLFVCNFGSQNMLFINFGEGKFIRTFISTDNDDSDAAEWVDIDNDGDLDLYVVNVKKPNVLFLNGDDGTFTQVQSSQILSDKRISGNCAWTDIDNDGDLDLLGNSIDEDQQNVWYENQGNDNHWIKIKLRGDESNFFGIGAKIRLTTTIHKRKVTQYRQLQTRPGRAQAGVYDILFGLADAKSVEQIEIIWPSGKIQKHNNLQTNTSICVEEGAGFYYYDLPTDQIAAFKEPALKDLAVEIVSDSMQMGQYHSISIFYENKGINSGDVTMKLELDKYLQFKNSFPAPSKKEGNYLEWNIKNLLPGGKGIITTAFRVPYDTSLIGQEIYTKVIIYPVAFDADKSNNTSQKSQIMK